LAGGCLGGGLGIDYRPGVRDEQGADDKEQQAEQQPLEAADETGLRRG
jgi:hypothetical protein